MSVHYLLDFDIFSSFLLLQLPLQAQRKQKNSHLQGKMQSKNGRISGCEQEFVYVISVCCATAGISAEAAGW